MLNLALLILLLPLIGFLLIGLNYKWLPVKVTGWIASAAVLISFLGSTFIFFKLLNGTPSESLILFDWIKAGNVRLPVELLIDQLSVLMLLIVTGVGFLIHIYSIGYMHGDEGYNRYFAYMNLFIFFMIILVLGGSYTIMFIGWEGVGLCSYLLIGFWYKNHEYNNAAKKAFIMNRIGDLGFLIGMFFIYYAFESLSYSTVFSKATTLIPGTAIITVTTLFLFMGAAGKSAQIPLLTWLPDAMAGPTPVSALIHAATMVTAGVYMVARSSILYAMAPVSMNVVAITGLATSLLAATIAMFQNDIKKVLAYSTISQLGLMFLGLGVGAFAGAMFHLMTHAFFKALLFLAAGSIIHALGGEQDLRNMGGLRKKIPLTFIVFLVATLAISGIPPFAGFFSKDEILFAVYLKSPVLWIAGVAVSVMTAFYIFRVLYLSFSGSYRGTIATPDKIHESPGVMTIPLLLLALLSFTGGFAGLPQSAGENRIGDFLTPVFANASYFLQNNNGSGTTLNLALMGVALILIVVSAFGAWYIFVKRRHVPANENIARKAFAGIVYNKFYIDELYREIIVKPLLKLSDVFHDKVDIKIFDRVIEAIGKLVMKAGERIRLLQTGNVGFYLFAMVICIIIVLAFSVFGK
jgi:NADH-quinone oxidoreductase subunit L